MSVVRQAGFTLSELLVVLTVATMVMAFAAIAAVPHLAKEAMRSTLHNGGTLVRAAKIEAVKRDRACRFVVDLTERVRCRSSTPTGPARPRTIPCCVRWPCRRSSAWPDPTRAPPSPSRPFGLRLPRRVRRRRARLLGGGRAGALLR